MAFARSSDTKPPHRFIVWGLLLLAVAFLAVMGVGVKVQHVEIVALGGAGFVLCASATCWAAWIGHRLRRTARERAAQAALNLMLVAELGRFGDAELLRVSQSSGPAAEVAHGLLAERRRRAEGTA